jgi:hypothetical protein
VLPLPAPELASKETVGLVASDPEDERPAVADEPPAQIIAGEPAEGFLEDVLGVLGGAEAEDEIAIQILSMAFIQLFEVQRAPYSLPLDKTRPVLIFV